MTVAASAAPVATPDSAFVKAMPWVFVLIWSTGFIVARYGMPHAPPMKFLALRYALSIACFLPLVYFAKVAWPQSTGQGIHLAVVGILVHACYLGGVWAAVKTGMGSGLTALIVGLQPVLTAIWLSATVSAISRRQWAGLALGLAGLVLVVSRKFGTGGEVTVLNLAFAVLGLFGITVGTLYQKRFVLPCDVRSANVVQLTAALVVTLPLALLEREGVHWNAEFAGAMAWSVLALTLGGSSLMYLLVQRGAAATVTSWMYLVAPMTALMAWFLFDEPITAVTLLGTVICVVGVGLVIRAAPSKKPSA